MRKFLVPAIAAATAAGALAVSTEASAQYYPYGRSNDLGAVTSAIQLAIGVLGGNSYGYSQPYGYGGYGYGSSPYGYGGSYPYGSNPYGNGQTPYGYGYGTSPYGANPYGYGYQCRTERVWDSYYRRYVYRQTC